VQLCGTIAAEDQQFFTVAGGVTITQRDFQVIP
jgi:hypothetical protein